MIGEVDADQPDMDQSIFRIVPRFESLEDLYIFTFHETARIDNYCDHYGFVKLFRKDLTKVIRGR